jgi:hypothetical protein
VHNTQNHNFTRCFIWACNFVSYTTGRTHIERVREQDTGGWTKGHKEELDNFHSSQNIAQVMRPTSNTIGVTRRTHSSDQQCMRSVGKKKYEGKRLLGQHASVKG